MRFHNISKRNASSAGVGGRHQLGGSGHPARSVPVTGEFEHEIRQTRRGTRGDHILGARRLRRRRRRRRDRRHRGDAPAAPTHRGTEASAGTDAPRHRGADGTTAPTAPRADGTTGGAEGLLGGEIPCDQQYEGKTVTVLSPVRNSETDPDAIQIFTDFWQPLVECTGVTIDFQGTDQFEVQAPVLIQGGSPPDVIDFPQPGLLRTLAPNLITFPDNLAEHAANDFIAGWEDLYTVDGEVKGIPWRANVKSTVWYSPAAFEEGGYEVPETLEELTALSDQIVADGGTPWCAGIESGVATGWPITDWFEDFMLRLNGPEVYDQWVNHEIPFNDPQVKAVADAVGSYPQEPRLHGRREQRQGDRHDEVPGRRRADRRPATATCTARPASTRRCSPRARRSSARPTAAATSRTSTCPSPKPATRR